MRLVPRYACTVRIVKRDRDGGGGVGGRGGVGGERRQARKRKGEIYGANER